MLRQHITSNRQDATYWIVGHWSADKDPMRAHEGTSLCSITQHGQLIVIVIVTILAPTRRPETLEHSEGGHSVPGKARHSGVPNGSLSTQQWRALCVDADKGIFNYYCDTNIIMENNNRSYLQCDATESTDRPTHHHSHELAPIVSTSEDSGPLITNQTLQPTAASSPKAAKCTLGPCARFRNALPIHRAPPL